MNLHERITDVERQISEIKNTYPLFHNDIDQNTLGPEARGAFDKFMDLKRIKIDLERAIQREERLQNPQQRNIQVRPERLFLDSGDESENLSSIHLPPIRGQSSLPHEMRRLNLSPISIGSESPLPDFFNKC